jgi:hypothetical protein
LRSQNNNQCTRIEEQNRTKPLTMNLPTVTQGRRILRILLPCICFLPIFRLGLSLFEVTHFSNASFITLLAVTIVLTILSCAVYAGHTWARLFLCLTLFISALLIFIGLDGDILSSTFSFNDVTYVDFLFSFLYFSFSLPLCFSHSITYHMQQELHETRKDT